MKKACVGAVVASEEWCMSCDVHTHTHTHTHTKYINQIVFYRPYIPIYVTRVYNVMYCSMYPALVVVSRALGSTPMAPPHYTRIGWISV